MWAIRLLAWGVLARIALGLVAVALGAGWLILGGAAGTLSSLERPLEASKLEHRLKRQEKAGKRRAALDTRRELRDLREPPGPDVIGTASGIASGAWAILRILLLAAVVVAAALLATRTVARGRRRYRRFWLRPSVTEVVDRDRMARLWEAWHQQQAYRWWERAVLGQPSFAPEISAVPVSGGGCELRVGVVLHDGPRVAGFLGRLRGAWQHVHIDEMDLEGPAWAVDTIRLKKRHRFSPKALAIAAPRRGELGEHLVDELRALAAEMRAPFTVQLAMVPAPGTYERRARTWFRQAERAAREERSSKLASSEFESGTRGVAWRGLFFGDVRILSGSRRVGEQVAGVIQGGLRAENLLRPRWVVVRRRLYARRARAGVANPIPGWRRQVFSSAECAALWALPTPFREAGETRAEIEPRLEPSHRLPRVSEPEALLRTQDGDHVGIEEEEALRLGLAIVGAQYMGKSSALLRWFSAAVRQGDTAGFLFDPKGGTAEAALRDLPPDVTVHYIDFERPEAGFSPLAGERSLSEKAETVTGAMIEATRTDQGESTVLASSKRFIHQVVMAAARAYDPATFWHTWLLCSASKQMNEIRLRLAREFGGEREMAGVALAFEELSVQLEGARSAMIQRLDAPGNKFYMLAGDPAVDRVLRHPHQVDVDRVIQHREVLIVNGAIGRLGPELTSMLLLMLLAMVHRAILRQESLPEPERARVALGLDEGHLFFSPTLQQILAMDRSSGLLAAVAWHFTEQIADRAARAGAFALLRNRFFFALERGDARRLSELLQPIHVDSLHARQEVREVVRIGPEVLANLSQHRCAVDQMHRGQRLPSWIGETLPMRGREEVARYHLDRQRARGGRIPSEEELELPAGVAGEVDLEREGGVDEHSAQQSRSEGTAPAPAPSRPDSDGASGSGGEDHKARRESVESPAPKRRGERSSERTTSPPPGAPTSKPLSDSYLELARYDRATGRVIRREERAARNPQPRRGRARSGETEGDRQARAKGLWVLDEVGPLPDELDLRILEALWELDFLSQPQIGHHLMPGASAVTVRKRMKRLFDEGWVNRLVISTEGSGRDPYVYAIARGGFEIARLVMTRRGTVIDQEERWPHEDVGQADGGAKEDRPRIGEAKWRQSEKQAVAQILHDLRAAEWTLRLATDLAANCVRGWRGAKGCWIAPPARRRADRKLEQLELAEIPKGAPGEIYAGLEERWQWPRPDARVECEVDLSDRVRRFDLFVEYERQLRPHDRFRSKVKAYDAFLTAWWRATDRYGRLHGEPGAVIVVCADGDAARRYAEAADREMAGVVLAAGRGAERSNYPGRSRIYFCAEADVHQRTTRAYGLDRLPPAMRQKVATNGRDRARAREPRLRVVNFLPHGLLSRPATLTRVNAPRTASQST